MFAKLKSIYTKYREILVYVVFGVLTTLVNWLTFALCNSALSASQTVSNAVAWVVGVAFAFFVNKRYVFESRTLAAKAVLREAAGFVGARALSGVVEIVGPTLLTRAGLDQTLFGLDGLLAKAVVSVVVIVLNYIFSKFFVFTDGNDRAAGKTAQRVYYVLCVAAVLGAGAWIVWDVFLK